MSATRGLEIRRLEELLEKDCERLALITQTLHVRVPATCS